MSSGTAMRILDANANRAREALRVLEDYARFALNHDELSGALKEVRHGLASATSELLAEAILHRDTPGDVGTDNKTASEARREDLAAVVTAAGKRLGEAMRVIEEILKTENPVQAATVEKLRYRFYDLEQKIARTLNPADRFAHVRLYVLITESICKRPWLEAAEQAILGGADCLQLREKDLESGELLRRARLLTDLCRRHDVLCIINDRPDIALLCGADGVHVGQTDLPAAEVRKIIGRNRIVGVSTHRIDQARQAVLDGADYLGVGPVFRSSTKTRDILPGPAYAKQVAESIKIPAVAIAGITEGNVDEVLATGLRAVAVTAAVIGCDDPRTAAERLKLKLPQASVGQTFLSATGGHSCPPVHSGRTCSDPAGTHTCPSCTQPELQKSRRRLPHWKLEGSTYFITFRMAEGDLSPDERTLILEHVQSGHDKFYTLIAAVVMPDHVHILLRPQPDYELSRIMKGTKGVTARKINELRASTGVIWQDESFDRIMRDQAELDEKLNYMLNNPVKRGLIEDPWQYPWWFYNQQANR